MATFHCDTIETCQGSAPGRNVHFDLGQAIGALKIALPYVEKIADTQRVEWLLQQRQQASRDAALIRRILADIGGTT